MEFQKDVLLQVWLFNTVYSMSFARADYEIETRIHAFHAKHGSVIASGTIGISLQNIHRWNIRSRSTLHTCVVLYSDSKRQNVSNEYTNDTMSNVYSRVGG